MSSIRDSMVTTFDGTPAKRIECRYIKGEFYKMDSQCFNIDGRWYRINSGYIVYDHETRNHVIKNSSLINGIVGVQEGEWEIGLFSENKNKNVLVYSGPDSPEIIAISESVPKNKGYIEIQSTDYEVFIDPKDFEGISKIRKNKVVPYKSLNSLPYNCYDSLAGAVNNFNKVNEPLKKPDEYNSIFMESLLLMGTFGLEFETDAGRIPQRYLARLGLIPLRDGSIAGDEYVTIPFAGRTEHLIALEDICSVLMRYTKMSIQNSLHIHVRVADFSKEFFLSAFLINTMLETELFSLFPAFYANTSKFKVSGKDYNRPLPDIGSLLSKTNPIDNVFDAVYSYYSAGRSFDGRTDRVHPEDGGGRKWQVNNRYVWCNFIPMLFGGNNTVEYRLHPPTSNYFKVLAWIAITNGILQYALMEKDKVCRKTSSMLEYLSENSIGLEEVLARVYPSKSRIYSLCVDYITYRKKLRAKMDSMSDGAGEYELKFDTEYVPDKTVLGFDARRILV